VIDKELLLKARLFEEDYEIPGLGTIRIRALSWDECAEFQRWSQQGKPTAEVYTRVLHRALVDPTLSEDEAATLLENATGGEIEALVARVIKASGLIEGAQKSA
jgi:hypothetical protein